MTGLGTPIVNFLVPDLVNYGGALTLPPGTLATGTIGSPTVDRSTASGGTGTDAAFPTTSPPAPCNRPGYFLSSGDSKLGIVSTPTTPGSVSFDVAGPMMTAAT